MTLPLHEQLLRKAKSGVVVRIGDQNLTLRVHVYSDKHPLAPSVEQSSSAHMVEISRKAFGEDETRIALGDNPVEGVKRFFHGNLTHYLFFLENHSGKPLAYAQVAVSEPRKSAYYTSAAISPEAQGKGTYELLNVLRAAACARHLGNSRNFHVSTRSENPKVIMHYSTRGWFPSLRRGKVVFSEQHRRGLKHARLAFLTGRLGESPSQARAGDALHQAINLYKTGPAESGAYSGKLAAVEPDARAKALLDQVEVTDKGEKRKFDAAKGDSLYLVTSSANLKKWLATQRNFIKTTLET